MISRLNLYDALGNKINVESIGLFGLKLNIPSPSYTVESEVIPGGQTIILDKQLNPRSLIGEFMAKANDYRDSLRLRDELFNLLGNGEEIYVGELHVPGKRWRVIVEEWTPERANQRVSKIDVPLYCASGLSESVNLIKQKRTTSSFQFKNEGNRLIDPRKQSETEITFKGASSNLTITNQTTGDVWKFNGTTIATDVIKLKGISSYKNGVSIFGQTNKKLLTFAVGNNNFTVGGAEEGFELSISTRFYFL